MTTFETTATPAPAKPRKNRSVPVAIGAVLATVGTVTALGGAGILALAGTDGTFESGTHAVSTSTTALVSETAKIDDTSDVTRVLGDTGVKVSAQASAGGPAVFVGVGRTADVNRYLANAPVDTVRDFEVDPWRLETTRHPGSASPKPPATQSFWVSKSVGNSPSIDWKIRDGSYRMVVMNADGSRGVATDARFELKIPHLSSLSLAALIVGLVMVGGGVALVAPSLRSSNEA